MSSTLFEKSHKGRDGINIPKQSVPDAPNLDENLLRSEKAELPELSEFDVVRHFTRLSNKNFSIDANFYPLGSCTMKYNPKIQERVGALAGFANLHPHHITNNQIHLVQGALSTLKTLENNLCEITGMDAFTLTPQAGAHGEMLGVMMIGAYHKKKGNNKRYVIVPDSSHGTNPATAAMVDYDVITVKSGPNGDMDLEAFKEAMSDEVAAVMMTVPNTLGLFNPQIKEICDIAHSYDALMYYDGANMNAILGVLRPGDIGFDVIHLNLHKTFATPHGGGGPGAGPVGVVKKLQEFLPDLQVSFNKKDGYFFNKPHENTIGKISPFFGNYLVLIRALVYMQTLGREGMINVSQKAVLNANYILAKLKDHIKAPFDSLCMHECVFSAEDLAKEHGVRAMDIAKYLLDFGLHAPTVYFPLIVKESIMIEPTETENIDTIDYFCQKMIDAIELAKSNPEAFKEFPKTLPISRPDETKAARSLNIRWQ
ncbi:aminomethyl-transferring glycine dehydrogenase subunit GcvPB [Sulfurospirillum arcachonense]|uniref:aminomethyl-transferring glycine dehydrogenase subunit GcvPB n=1 Tax=Sulfurospirillum arcachonense TaxID=57666 RepID=UPI00046ABB2B|nr:aminomethyl-transferring glycine dehydrogenase subunit GcvPB [Sulfurospirillum arcachonense]